MLTLRLVAELPPYCTSKQPQWMVQRTVEKPVQSNSENCNATRCYSGVSHVLLRKRQRTVGKATGKPSDIERFNNTLRQRVSALVRKTFAQNR